MLKIIIKKGHMGDLEFSIFSIGHQINEYQIFKPEHRMVKAGDIIEEPTFSVPMHSANEFMLALKDAIREYEGSTPDFSQGELKATKYHLEDIRSLLNRLLGTGV